MISDLHSQRILILTSRASGLCLSYGFPHRWSVYIDARDLARVALSYMCGGARGRCPPPRPPAVPRAPRVTRGCSLIQVAAEVEAGPRPCALALPTGTWIHMRPRRGTREPQSPNHPRDRHRSVGQPFVAPGAPCASQAQCTRGLCSSPLPLPFEQHIRLCRLFDAVAVDDDVGSLSVRPI